MYFWFPMSPVTGEAPRQEFFVGIQQKDADRVEREVGLNRAYDKILRRFLEPDAAVAVAS